jgi:hypothetical protein
MLLLPSQPVFTCRQCYVSLKKLQNAYSDPKFSQKLGLVISIPGKEGSGTLFWVASSEKELPKWRSGAKIPLLADHFLY